jgi:hypothetical protein
MDFGGAGLTNELHQLPQGCYRERSNLQQPLPAILQMPYTVLNLTRTPKSRMVW